MLNKDPQEDVLLGKTISWLRFPLIIGVVFIHTNLVILYVDGNPLNSWLEAIINLLTSVIPRTSVPLFFLISGFLFFHKTDFGKKVYLNKIKKRAQTLLIPYIIWNFIDYLFFCIKHLPHVSNVFRNTQLVEVSWKSFFSAFWDFKLINPYLEGNFPINYPFWFVRDLMIVMLFAPVIYYLVKKMNIFPIIALGLCWFFNLWFDIAGFSIAAWFFFSLGAYLSIKKKNPVTVFREVGRISFLTYPIVAILYLVFFYNKCIAFYIDKFAIAMGIMALFYIIPSLITKKKIRENNFLSSSSFFVFSFHSLLIVNMMKVLNLLIKPESSFTYLCIYFLSPIITILLCLVIFKYLKKLFPKFTSAISGNR